MAAFIDRLQDAEFDRSAPVTAPTARQPAARQALRDESLLERVDRTAESLGETRSGFLAAAARKRLADAAS